MVYYTSVSLSDVDGVGTCRYFLPATNDVKVTAASILPNLEEMSYMIFKTKTTLLLFHC